MRHRFFIFLSAFLFYTHVAIASDTILAAVPSASVVGHGVLTYAFWDVYKATLYAPKGRFDPRKPFALSIEYYHALGGRDIADKSVKEMRKQGFVDDAKLAAWHTQMKAIFPDVKKGTVLSAVYTSKKQTTFYNGNRIIGAIKGDEFGKAFFGIWLSEKTSEAALRRALLGMS